MPRHLIGRIIHRCCAVFCQQWLSRQSAAQSLGYPKTWRQAGQKNDLSCTGDGRHDGKSM